MTGTFTIIFTIIFVTLLNFLLAFNLKQGLAISSTHNNALKYFFVIPPIAIIVSLILVFYFLVNDLINKIIKYFKK